MSIHEDLGRKPIVHASSDRSFAVLLAAVLVVVGAWPLARGDSPSLMALASAGVAALIAAFRPSILAPANRAWSALGRAMGAVAAPVATAVLFYGAIVPCGLLMRLAGRDLLRLRRDAQAKSYWIERDPPGPDPDSMPRQF
jgi:hypothetical protein